MFYIIETSVPSRSPQYGQETVNTGELPPVPVLLDRIAQIVDDLDAADIPGVWDRLIAEVQNDVEHAADFAERGSWEYKTPDGGYVTARVDTIAERNAEADRRADELNNDWERVGELSRTYPTVITECARGMLTASLWADAWPANMDDSSETGGLEHLDPDANAVAAYERMAAMFVGAAWADLPAYAGLRENTTNSSVWDVLGHDLWLSAGGHGTGFWDRGLSKLGDRLHAIAGRRPFASMGDDLQLSANDDSTAGL
jgi:hypothetical protein